MCQVSVSCYLLLTYVAYNYVNISKTLLYIKDHLIKTQSDVLMSENEKGDSSIHIVSDIIFVQVHRCNLYRKSALHISKMASQALIYKQVTLIQNVVNKNMLTKNPEQYLLFCLTCQNIRVNSIQSIKLVKKYFEEINLFLAHLS